MQPVVNLSLRIPPLYMRAIAGTLAHFATSTNALH
jgi:hypothetical protein